MATRRVTRVMRDNRGRTTALAGEGASWSPRGAQMVMDDIRAGKHVYVAVTSSAETDIHVVAGSDGSYLRTDWDATSANNLDDLPLYTVGPVSPEIVQRYAPLLRIHPDEKHFPMDPLAFLQDSRFRHHRFGASDQGYNKVTEKWVETNSGHANYRNIPVPYIDSFGLNPDGSNRRPRDTKSGNSWNVFVQPRGKPVGISDPNGVVPVFYFARTDNSTWHGLGTTFIQYWWFMGYNDGFLIQNHQGDWEHATAVVKDGELKGAYLSAHGRPQYHDTGSLEPYGKRFQVYLAKGSHAAYSRVGTFHGGTDRTNVGGREWHTWQNLQALAIQPWRHFAGAWGEVGASMFTTGPLGPWHQRRKM